MIAGILWKNPPQKCVFCIFYQSFKLLSDDCINSISNNFLFDDLQFYRSSNIDCNECDISNIFRWWWCDSPHYLNPVWLMIYGGGEGRSFSSLCTAVLRAEWGTASCSPPVKYFMVEKILSENSALPAPKRHGVDQRTGAGGGREGWDREGEDLAVNNSR